MSPTVTRATGTRSAVDDRHAPSSDATADDPRDSASPTGRAAIPSLAQLLASPIIRFALLMITGIILGRLWHIIWFWLALAALSLLATLVLHRRRPEAAAFACRCLWALSIVALSACWLIARESHLPADALERHVTHEPHLAQVTGVVRGPIRVSAPQSGPFARFSYQTPASFARLDVHTIWINGEHQPVRGSLMLKLEQADHRLQPGMHVRATGWLAGYRGPSNPGEFDFARLMQQRGIAGRLSLRQRGNWQAIDPPPTTIAVAALAPWHHLQHWRQRTADKALDALGLGMEEHDRELQLLELLLLGRRDRADPQMHSSFRRIGLAHVLAISGAHLGILLGMTWLAARLCVGHPRWVAIIVLVVLGVYLLILPLRVPIVRAAIMAGVFALGYASGRQVRGMDLLAIAAIIVLLWQPTDLFQPGFQLSFLIVAGLLLYTTPLAHWLWPPAMSLPINAQDHHPTHHQSGGEMIGRLLLNYLAMSTVAFLIALPLAAYHFKLISPLAILLSMLALPVLAAILALGFVKMAFSAILPSVGIMLAGPLAWVSDSMLRLVDHAQTWPGVAVELFHQPAWWWAVAGLCWAAVLLHDMFRQRRIAMTCAGIILIGWLSVNEWAVGRSAWWQTNPNQPAMILNVFAVGDGSCLLLRTSEYTLMYDCGSQNYFDIGTQSIVPALRHLGVRHIDTLMLSHPDLDHYCGTLDVIDHISVGRVLVPPQLMFEAATRPHSAIEHLARELDARGIEPIVVTRGWHERHGGLELDLLWPPPEMIARQSNDTSLVLAARKAGVRILFNGDIQQKAQSMLLEKGIDLRADICEMPHHGSFVPVSPQWLEAVQPQILLQSSGPARLRNDRWADTLADYRENIAPIQRLITAERGMIEIRVYHDGRIHWTTFRVEEEGTRH